MAIVSIVDSMTNLDLCVRKVVSLAMRLRIRFRWRLLASLVARVDLDSEVFLLVVVVADSLVVERVRCAAVTS